MIPCAVGEHIWCRSADLLVVGHENGVSTFGIRNDSAGRFRGVDDAVLECKQRTEPPAIGRVSYYKVLSEPQRDCVLSRSETETSLPPRKKWTQLDTWRLQPRDDQFLLAEVLWFADSTQPASWFVE